MLQVEQNRARLSKTIEAIRRGGITVGFIGGSITDSRNRNNWPAPFAAWLVNKFPACRVSIENAAIGATGSDLAVFRAERDLINRNCDIVFVEYAVNDYSVPQPQRMRSREGLIRKLLKASIEVVLVYTFMQEMYENMVDGEMPDSIREFEQLAGHYSLNSVWMGLYAFNEVKKGLMRWEEWLPDGLHPQSRGSLSYAQSVINFFEKALNEPTSGNVKALAGPICSGNWENTAFVPFNEIKTYGPWLVERWNNHKWIDQVMSTSSFDAGFSLSFIGRGVVIALDFGHTSAEYCWRLDKGEWTKTDHKRYPWHGDEGWFFLDVLADGIKNGNHTLNVKIVHGNTEGCMGTNFRMAFVGVIKDF